MATAQERATETFNEMATRWATKVGDDFRVNVGSGQSRRTLVFYQQPQLTLDGKGIECWVRLLDRNGNVIPIDEHRIIINPPTVPRAGIRADGNHVKDVGQALLEALLDSIAAMPGLPS
jgi:hypothetical protein